MEIKNIKSVTHSYLFFINDDGKEDRKKVDRLELQEILNDLQSDYYFYNRMYSETESIYKRVNTEYEKLKNSASDMRRHIEMNKCDSLVRRGLANICLDYEYTKEKMMSVVDKLTGIREVLNDTIEKITHIEKLINEIEAVMHVINK